MQYPRAKHPHRARRFGEGRVRVGGAVFGVAAELEDAHGWIWALLELLDGTRTVDQAVQILVHRFPDLSEADARDGAAQLIATGYFEDAAEPEPADLSADEQDRYSRSRSLFTWVDLTPRESSWDPQRRLRDARVLLIGVGGTGSTVALALTSSGVGRLHLVEPDVVELSNLNRQVLYRESDLGRPKVDVAVERLREHNSQVKLSGERATLDTAAKLAAASDGWDLVVLCGDKPADIRGLANQAFLSTGTPWVYGGYHGPQVTTGVFRPGTGPCYECVRQADERKRDGESGQQPWLGAPPVHAANAISAGMSGNLVAHAAMAMLTGAPKLPVNAVYGLNLIRPDHSFVTTVAKPLPGCPACGGAE
jgi:molybdopterin/thiamine biosynthesis adenylyltransferase